MGLCFPSFQQFILSYHICVRDYSTLPPLLLSGQTTLAPVPHRPSNPTIICPHSHILLWVLHTALGSTNLHSASELQPSVWPVGILKGGKCYDFNNFTPLDQLLALFYCFIITCENHMILVCQLLNYKQSSTKFDTEWGSDH